MQVSQFSPDRSGYTIFIINRDNCLTGIKPQRILFCSVLETAKLHCWESSQKNLLKPYYFVSDVIKVK